MSDVQKTLLIATILREKGPTGVQTHFATFMKWISSRNRHAIVVTPFDASRILFYMLAGARRGLERLSPAGAVWLYRRGHGLLLRLSLRKQLRKNRLSVIYAQCPVSADAALRARLYPSQRVVLVIHFNHSQAEEWADKGWITKYGALYRSIIQFESDVLAKVDGIVFVSDYMRARIMEAVPAIRDIPSLLAPNFVDVPELPDRQSKDSRALMCVGTLEPRKNQRYALQIVAAARRLGREISLLIVGDGPDRADLEAMAKELQIAESVTFAGRVNGAASKFGNVGACLHVSIAENMPLALIEALSMATPIFAVPVGGIPEIFQDGVEGINLPSESAERAAALICQYLYDDEWLARAGSSSRTRFEHRFSTPLVASKLWRFIVEEGDSVAVPTEQLVGSP